MAQELHSRVQPLCHYDNTKIKARQAEAIGDHEPTQVHGMDYISLIAVRCLPAEDCELSDSNTAIYCQKSRHVGVALSFRLRE